MELPAPQWKSLFFSDLFTELFWNNKGRNNNKGFSAQKPLDSLHLLHHLTVFNLQVEENEEDIWAMTESKGADQNPPGGIYLYGGAKSRRGRDLL